MLRAIALAAALVALAPGVARGSSAWSWPVRGRVVGSFSLSAADPYAAGRHRGIAIAARPGAEVHAACSGRVAFAGSVGRAGPTLSVVCGGLRSTYQGLAGIAVARGAHVAAGQSVAALDGRGVLRLGAFTDDRAHRYLDPAGLLRGPSAAAPPLGPAPVGSVRRVPSPPSASPGPRRSPPQADRAPDRAPPLAWLGLILLAAGAPVSSLWRRRRRSAATAGFRTWALRQLR